MRDGRRVHAKNMFIINNSLSPTLYSNQVIGKLNVNLIPDDQQLMYFECVRFATGYVTNNTSTMHQHHHKVCDGVGARSDHNLKIEEVSGSILFHQTIVPAREEVK